MKNSESNQDQKFQISIPQGMERESSKNGNSSIYRNEFSKGGKKMRDKIRKKFESIRNDFFGKDRKEEEKLNALDRGLIEYRKFHLIQDFKIQNFSQSRNEEILKESSILLQNMESYFKSKYGGEWKSIDAKIKKGE